MSAPRVVMVTGAAGFIGANTVAWLLRNRPEVFVVSYDAFTYAAHPDSLAMVTAGFEQRHALVRGDVRDAAQLHAVLSGRAHDATGAAIPSPDTIWHLAAETHVDRSILDPTTFVDANVGGTLRVLEEVRAAAQRGQHLRLVHVSTDEVYGSLAPTDAPFVEGRALDPSSPYAASKAAADLLVAGWAKTFGLDAVITRCSNNYGPFQFPEKLIPLMITRALAGERLPVYGDGRQVRDWLHVDDHASALWAVTTSAASEGRVFHIGASGERENLDVVHRVLDTLGADRGLVEHVRDRPAHDRRYAMDASRLRAETEWSPRVSFDEGLAATIAWYRERETWWRALQREAHRASDALYATDAR